MKIGEALEIVHKLAQHAYEIEDNDGFGGVRKVGEALVQWRADQARTLEALNMVEDLIVNEYGEEEEGGDGNS